MIDSIIILSGPLPSENGTPLNVLRTFTGQNLALTVLNVPHSLDSGVAQLPQLWQGGGKGKGEGKGKR